MSVRVLLAAGAAACALGAAAQAQSATEAGDILIRARAIGVLPNEEASISPIGGDISISDQVVPEIDFTYFFTDNLALELIAAVTPHDIDAVGTALGDLTVGDTTLLPPTLTLQYHFQTGTAFRPYVGVGVNYTTFYDVDTPFDSLNLEDSFGLAAQAGFDYHFNEDWFVNFDVKLVDISTEATIDASTAVAPGTIVNADVDIDPWIVGIGVGRRF